MWLLSMVIGNDFVVIYLSGCRDPKRVAHRQNPAPTDRPLWDLDVFLQDNNPPRPGSNFPFPWPSFSSLVPLGGFFTDFTCLAPEVFCVATLLISIDYWIWKETERSQNATLSLYSWENSDPELGSSLPETSPKVNGRVKTRRKSGSLWQARTRY